MSETRMVSRTARVVANATLIYQADNEIIDVEWVHTPHKIERPNPDLRYRPADPMLGQAQLGYASAPLDFRVNFMTIASAATLQGGQIDCYYRCDSTGDYNNATGKCTYYNCQRVALAVLRPRLQCGRACPRF